MNTAIWLRRHRLLFGGCLLVGAAVLLRAQSQYEWTGAGTNNNWSTVANWGGVAPANDGSADIHFFDLGVPFSANVDAPWSIRSLSFNTATNACTLDGATLTIGAGGITDYCRVAPQTISNAVTLGASQTWTANTSYSSPNGATLALTNTGTITGAGFGLILDGDGSGSIAGAIDTGSGSLTKNGNGTWTLTGTNTYSGGTTINAGTLQLGVGGSGGPVAGDITDNGVLVFNRSDNVTYSGNISGAGSLAKSGTGTLTLAGNNTYSGNYGSGPNWSGTTVHFGTLVVDGGSINHPSSTVWVGLFADDDGTFKIINGSTVSSGYVFVGGANFWDASTGTMIISGGSTLVSHDGLIGNAFGGPSLGTVIVDGRGSSWTITPAEGYNDDLEVGLGTSSTGSLIITNGGTVHGGGYTGIGDNDSTGSVTVDGAGSSLSVLGALDLANYPGSIATVTITNGGSVSGTTTWLARRIAGPSTDSVATVTVDGAGSSWTFTGDYFVGYSGAGTLSLANGGALNGNTGSDTVTLGVQSGSTGTFHIGAALAGSAAAGGIVNAAAVTTGSGTGTIQFNTTATLGSPYYFTNDSTAGGAAVVISGPTNVINTGGCNVLTGANTYTGATKIDAGALRITGIFGSAANAVSINSGGALIGNGSVNRPITLNSGGLLAPDGAAPIATLSGASLTWNGGGKLAVDLGASGASDALALSGALTKGTAGTFEVALAPGAGFGAGNTYTLATFSSTDFAAGDFTFTGLPAGYAPACTVTANSLQLTILGQPTITLAGLVQAFDGTPKAVTATTNPSGLTVDITYNGSSTPPTLPGSYAVVATIDNPNYTGTDSDTLVITITALVCHGVTLNGNIDGSVQVLHPENTTLNGAMVSGDLLVPGTPTVRLNGRPTYGSTVDGTGSASPSNYTVILNGNAILRHVVRRVDAIALPTVSSPPQPAGTRNVSLNSAGQSVGDFTTVRNLTLNGNAGQVAVPPGTYGTFAANGNSGFVLGVAGATQPAVYNLQGLTLNGNSQLQVVGPVFLTLASSATFNGAVGSSAHLDWLTLNVYSGGVTLNGNVTFNGRVVAPAGAVIINGNSTLNGGVACDRLTINGNGLVSEQPQ